MKLFPRPPSPNQGMAVIAVIALLSLLFIYVTANARALHLLGRDLKLVEQKQIQRLNPLLKTNSVVHTNLPTVSPAPAP